jgi:DNA polymerase elongation subunit (family B)
LKQEEGQTVRYLIADAENKMPNMRVRVAELVNDDTRFDTEKYVDMLILAGANILAPFEPTEKRFGDHIVYGQKQMPLKLTATAN